MEIYHGLRIQSVKLRKSVYSQATHIEAIYVLKAGVHDENENPSVI